MPNLTIKSPGAVEKEGETVPIRHRLAEDGFISTHDPDVTTIYENFQHSVRLYGIHEFS